VSWPRSRWPWRFSPWWATCAACLLMAACLASPSSPPTGPQGLVPPPVGASIDIGAGQPGQDGPWTFVAYRSPLPPSEALVSYFSTLESSGFRRGEDQGPWHAFRRGELIVMVAVSPDGPPTSILVRVARIGDLPELGSLVPSAPGPPPASAAAVLGTPDPPSRGQASTPLGQGGTPPGQASVPPGQGGTPPGQGGTPPGQGGTPPGQGGTPPGQGGTPPGQASTPPGQASTPPGQGGTPPGRNSTPPGQGGIPPGPPSSPPGQDSSQRQASPRPTQSSVGAGQPSTPPGQAPAPPGRAENAPGQPSTPPGQAPLKVGADGANAGFEPGPSGSGRGVP
jgi:hypothetical protein